MVKKFGVVGFSLSVHYLSRFISNMEEVLTHLAQLEVMMIAFERCCYYIDLEPEEGYRGLDKFKKAAQKSMKRIKLESAKIRHREWPGQGEIQVDKLSVRYRKELDPVLHNLSFSVPGGDKVAIIGRTGAGKSTLISAFCHAFDQVEGNIFLDGEKYSDLELKVLRGNIALIPQTPALFEDNIKRNLDPLGLYTNQEIKIMLKKVDMLDKVEELGGIEGFEVTKGVNFSQGEKQLLCFGKAALNKRKLILMDEATSNLDLATQKQIQTLVVNEFEDSTLFLIAHRLETIMFCDW